MLSTSRPASAKLRTLGVLFFFSGLSSLVFETLFTRLLTYSFGNTAQAVSTVLAAFLGGLALGALLFGRWVDRRPPSLWIYAGLELGAGVYCVFTPRLLALVTAGYVALFHRFHLSLLSLTAVRFALASLVIVIPSLLMGGSLPALARYVSSGCQDFAPQVDLLYARNTQGAAAGALASTFLFMPIWGVKGTLGIACGINLAIFLAVAWLVRLPVFAQGAGDAPSQSPLPEVATAIPARRLGLLAASFLTGAVALGYEVLWTHILAFTVGNSVYAFGVMLFALLCGLGWGAEIVARRFGDPAAAAPALAGSQVLLGFAVLLTVPLWDRIPQFFNLGLGRAACLGLASLVVFRIAVVAVRRRQESRKGLFGWLRRNEPVVEALLFCALAGGSSILWKFDNTFFVASELARFSCAFLLLAGPAVLLGLSFPLLLNLYTQGRVAPGRSVGGIYASNTAGAILGSLLVGFGVLPRFGSLTSLRAAATLNVLLGGLFAFFLLPSRRRRSLAWALVTVPMIIGLWVFPRGWNLHRLTVGSYVYFGAADRPDRVLYAREDTQGGLTTVVQVGPERILLSNGKFQGNNAGEVPAQIQFALIPVLFTPQFRNALVIGLGTGNTLRSLSQFPFERIDAAELAPTIVDAARRWFQDVNGRVLDDDPRVHLSVADGRNFLLLSRDRYDLITIEITSIWISGEADLYNREFYELCRAHLGDHGILQQWVQIHHMRTPDLLVILNTAAQVFPYVAFFQGPEQGLLIASASPLQCDYPLIEGFDRDRRVRQELRAIGAPSLWSLLGELMLYGESLRRGLSRLSDLSGLPADFASTDYYPYLEYRTPKANVLPYDTAPLNLEFLRGLRPPQPPVDLLVQNAPSPGARNLVRGYCLEQRGDLDAALECFQRVDGPRRAQAELEIRRIELKQGASAR